MGLILTRVSALRCKMWGALTGKKVKPIKKSAVRDLLLHCNYLPSFYLLS